jgi:hypothetical protein
VGVGAIPPPFVIVEVSGGNNMEIIISKVSNHPQLIPYFNDPYFGFGQDLEIILTPFNKTLNSWVNDNTENYINKDEEFYTPTFSITYNDNQYIAWHMPPTPFDARNVQFDPESTMYRDD